jgi:predicted nucleic acid-binding protein
VRRHDPPKYVLDTNLYIDAFRDAAAKAALQRFHYRYAPFAYLSVVVVQELLAGARRPDHQKAIERNVLSTYERTDRVIVPTADAWHRSGDVLAAMVRKEGLELARVSKSFGNDILLAASCREAGCVLITDNMRDFSRIGQFLPFDFVAPWP